MWVRSVFAHSHLPTSGQWNVRRANVVTHTCVGSVDGPIGMETRKCRTQKLHSDAFYLAASGGYLLCNELCRKGVVDVSSRKRRIRTLALNISIS